MIKAEDFKDRLFNINAQNFEEHALALFRWQATHNVVYQEYIDHLRKDIYSITRLEDIPFLPITFFKNHQVVSQATEQKPVSWENFESSGTTGQQRSRHFVSDKEFYLRVCQHIFEQQYGPLNDFHVFALLPSYLERNNSSLVAMADHFIRESHSPLSGFYLYDYQALLERLAKAQHTKQPVLLLGVTFALLELAEQHRANLRGVTVMETGGMKGRRKEIIREELHLILKQGLKINSVHSEYGMTELMSQAYSMGSGIFKAPTWMRFFIRDINDPFLLNNQLSYGGINIIDLANVESCAFIETQDLGKYHIEDQSFEVLGRMDNTDTRGCNLMVF